MGAAAFASQSLADYFDQEETAVERHEFNNGSIIEMSGGTPNHDLIGTNTTRELSIRLKNRPCRVHSSNLKIYIRFANRIVYPDAMVICGPNEFMPGRSDTIVNPKVVIEVLSPSTEAADRGSKFNSYQTIESLDTYVLVAQDRPRVERFVRRPDGWLLTTFDGLDSTLELPSLEIGVPLAEIFDKIAFPDNPPILVESSDPSSR